MSDENKSLTPVWICYVDGKRLDTKHEGALKSITINDRLNGIGSCVLKFDISAEKLLELGTFNLESKISVHLGYKDDVEEVFSGEITGFKGHFMELGHEMCEIVCSNAIHKLNHGVHCVSFENKTCSEYIKEIIEKYSLKADIDDFGSSFEYDGFNSISDLDYIAECCKKYGKDFYAYDNTVYIKDCIQVRDDDLVFEWGKSLIEFHSFCNIIDLLSDSNCIGHDANKNEDISGTAKLSDLPIQLGGSKDWTKISKGGNGLYYNTITDLRFFDSDDAKNTAIGILQNNSYSFMTANGTVEGTYKLLPGMRVTIKYVGKLFEGEYIAESVTHSFDIARGYKTSFTLKRNMCS